MNVEAMVSCEVSTHAEVCWFFWIAQVKKQTRLKLVTGGLMKTWHRRGGTCWRSKSRGSWSRKNECLAGPEHFEVGRVVESTCSLRIFGSGFIQTERIEDHKWDVRPQCSGFKEVARQLHGFEIIKGWIPQIALWYAWNGLHCGNWMEIKDPRVHPPGSDTQTESMSRISLTHGPSVDTSYISFLAIRT
jgi:hypothetical protein